MTQQASGKSASTAALARMAAECRASAAADSAAEEPLLERLAAVERLLEADSQPAGRFAALRLVSQLQPAWAQCEACGKSRSAKHPSL